MYFFNVFGIKSKKQKKIIKNDIVRILDRCDKISNEKYVEQKEAKESHDGICPKCRHKKEHIVTKIISYNVENKISADVRLFNLKLKNDINGSFYEINHCNNCGNEWIKYKTKYVDKTRILNVALRYLSEILENPDQNIPSFKIETIKVFDDCTVESIYELYKKSKMESYFKIKPSQLKRNYKTVLN